MNIMSNLLLEDVLYALLVRGSDVSEAEGHGSVTVCAEGRDEHHFFLILNGHLDMFIPGVCVKEA
jgi:hypothetical protein